MLMFVMASWLFQRQLAKSKTKHAGINSALN